MHQRIAGECTSQFRVLSEPAIRARSGQATHTCFRAHILLRACLLTAGTTLPCEIITARRRECCIDLSKRACYLGGQFKCRRDVVLRYIYGFTVPDKRKCNRENVFPNDDVQNSLHQCYFTSPLLTMQRMAHTLLCIATWLHDCGTVIMVAV